jgi:hypothetical protein
MMISTYVETGILGTRKWELAEDSVALSSHQRFGSIHEQRFTLGSLVSTPARSWVRDLRLESVIGWGSMFVLLAFIAFINVQGGDISDPAAYARALWVVIGVVLFTIAMYLIFPRRIEFATFTNSSGLATFAIGRRGENAAEFETFVTRLSQQILARSGV